MIIFFGGELVIVCWKVFRSMLKTVPWSFLWSLQKIPWWWITDIWYFWWEMLGWRECITKWRHCTALLHFHHQPPQVPPPPFHPPTHLYQAGRRVIWWSHPIIADTASDTTPLCLLMREMQTRIEIKPAGQEVPTYLISFPGLNYLDFHDSTFSFFSTKLLIYVITRVSVKLYGKSSSPAFYIMSPRYECGSLTKTLQL